MKLIKTLQTEKKWWNTTITDDELLKPYRSSWELYHWEIIYNKIISLYNFRNKTVFEGGCGTGLFIEWVMKNKLQRPKYAVGMDLCDRMIEYAQFRNKKYKNTLFRVGNIEHTKFERNAFDACVIIDALHHVPSIPKTLKEMKRIGRDLIISEPNALNPVRRYNEQKYKNIGVKESSFYLWELKKALRDAGYYRIHIYHQHFIPSTLPDFVSTKLFKLDPFFSNFPVLNKISGSFLIIAEA